MSTPFLVRLLVNTDQHELAISGSIQDIPQPLSGIYLTLLLPDTLATVKSSVICRANQPETHVETIYGPQADNGAVEVLVTAGSTQVPIKLRVQSPQGHVNGAGVTGQTVTLRLPV